MQKWYVLQVYSGTEKTAKKSLQDDIDRSNIAHLFGDILVPVEEVLDIKDGKKTIVERKFFPGYILIQMELNDDTWYLVKNCKKIASFVGGGKQKPVPITQIEVDRILKSVQLSSEKPKPRIEFVIGEKLRVIDGPFDDFVGQVEEIFYDKSRLRIGIEILGRMTPVELDFSQVEKEFI